MPIASVEREVVYRSYPERVASSSSGACCSIFMLVLVVPFMFWLEAWAVARDATLADAFARVKPVDLRFAADPSLNGEIIHVSGPLTMESHNNYNNNNNNNNHGSQNNNNHGNARGGTESLGSGVRDRDFGIDLPGALALTREVEMYQFVERTTTRRRREIVGAESEERTYVLETEWARTLKHSPWESYGRHPGMRNPNSWPDGVGPIDIRARDGVSLGPLEASLAVENLPRAAFSPLFGRDAFSGAGAGSLRTPSIRWTVLDGDDSSHGVRHRNHRRNSHASEAASGLRLEAYFSAERGSGPLDPAVGDVRVSWSWVRQPCPVSVIATVSRGSLRAGLDNPQSHDANAKNPLVAVAFGEPKTAAELIDAEARSMRALVFAGRAVAALFMFAAFRAGLEPLAVALSPIPVVAQFARIGATAGAACAAAVCFSVVWAVAWAAARPVQAIAAAALAVAVVVFAASRPAVDAKAD